MCRTTPSTSPPGVSTVMTAPLWLLLVPWYTTSSEGLLIPPF